MADDDDSKVVMFRAKPVRSGDNHPPKTPERLHVASKVDALANLEAFRLAEMRVAVMSTIQGAYLGGASEDDLQRWLIEAIANVRDKRNKDD